MWTNVKTGPATALNKLLHRPLHFDAPSFVRRTFSSSDTNKFRMLELAAQRFEEFRLDLLPKMPKIMFQLSTESAPITQVPSEFFTLRFRKGQKIVDKKCKVDVINTQLDRLIESFEIKNRGFKEPSSEEILTTLKFFWLSENLYLLFIGIAEYEEVDECKYHFLYNNKKRDILLQEWVAQRWEMMSNVSNIAYYQNAPSGSISSVKVRLFIRSMAENLRDKIFSIQFDTKFKDFDNLAVLPLIDDYCILIAALIWAKNKRSCGSVCMEEFFELGISSESVKKIIELQSEVNAVDKILSLSNDNVRLENYHFQYQLRGIIKVIFDQLDDSKKGKVSNAFGTQFERGIKNRERNYSGRYYFFDGITYRDNLHGDEVLDVDLVIKDLRRNKYYFIQVKYSLVGGMAYLNGDNWYTRRSKKTIQKAIRQLKSAKKLHESGALSGSLTEIGADDCSIENTEYIIVHNISNLDFQVSDSGIAMYEWNTFRNLLADGRCTYQRTNQSEPVEWTTKYPLPLESPIDVIKSLLKKSPIFSAFGYNSIEKTFELESQIEINGKSVSSTGLGL